MKLSEADIFIIKTIARYTFLDKCEKEGIISKEMFNSFYDKFSDIQKNIISNFIEEETTLIENAGERISEDL